MNNPGEVLGQMSKVVTTNTKTMGVLASRGGLGKFFASQCVEISRSFRRGIEDAKSLMDDVALRAEYHSALLELTNTILGSLKESARDR